MKMTLGGYRLKDGQAVWQNGPVIEAMERGALLLLDEIDLTLTRLCVYNRYLKVQVSMLRKINKFVKLSNGFNVVLLQY